VNDERKEWQLNLLGRESIKDEDHLPCCPVYPKNKAIQDNHQKEEDKDPENMLYSKGNNTMNKEKGMFCLQRIQKVIQLIARLLPIFR